MNGHCNHLALKLSVCVKERQDRLPTMYWLPKLHKRPIKHDLLQNSSSCATAELVLFELRLNVPVNNFSVMSGRSHCFLGN